MTAVILAIFITISAFGMLANIRANRAYLAAGWAFAFACCLAAVFA